MHWLAIALLTTLCLVGVVGTVSAEKQLSKKPQRAVLYLWHDRGSTEPNKPIPALMNHFGTGTAAVMFEVDIGVHGDVVTHEGNEYSAHEVLENMRLGNIKYQVIDAAAARKLGLETGPSSKCPFCGKAK